ncbi:hypothetical protein LJY25_14940 [Hymenobacter sp. BT175]|uniref:hypothetical protein n=1 Tax=Hymenobacter translucens TaxID=2886507 RepID=UPI001D0E4550|nr:hypothetical protein [Hymenobacter translucens]MCC2547746.1 hypothetical protein [Hymenobacter translucens]
MNEKSTRNRALLLLLFLVISAPVRAQIGAVMALARIGTSVAINSMMDQTFRINGSGGYQLTSAGEWVPAERLELSSKGLMIGKGKAARELTLTDFSQTIIRGDTFAILRGVQFPGAAVDPQAAPLFAKRTWHHPQAELYEFVSGSGAVPLLRFPDGSAVMVPVKKKEFQYTMLALVGDHPTLARQLQANELSSVHLREILRAYLTWKPAGLTKPAPTALYLPEK